MARWNVAPTAGQYRRPMRRVQNDATSIYFLDATLANAFVAVRWPNAW
ncbi:MAG: hypothetical protein J2P48_20575 [Alphaproteobacteria bacterium]|nr:hypothetical protein [Alphaproteobacteria bacterium]